MMIVSISAAKATLSALLERVRAGETITITDRGIPVAQLAPLDEPLALAALRENFPVLGA